MTVSGLCQARPRLPRRPRGHSHLSRRRRKDNRCPPRAFASVYLPLCLPSCAARPLYALPAYPRSLLCTCAHVPWYCCNWRGRMTCTQLHMQMRFTRLWCDGGVFCDAVLCVCCWRGVVVCACWHVCACAAAVKSLLENNADLVHHSSDTLFQGQVCCTHTPLAACCPLPASHLLQSVALVVRSPAVAIFLHDCS